MRGQSSAQRERFLPDVCQLIMSDAGHFLTLNNYLHQTVANLPQNATAIVNFPKTNEVCFFLKKSRLVFPEKNFDFFRNR